MNKKNKNLLELVITLLLCFILFSLISAIIKGVFGGGELGYIINMIFWIIVAVWAINRSRKRK